MHSISGVYAMFNKATKEIYIGSSVNIQKRHTAHLCLLRKGQHACKPLQKAWDQERTPEKSFTLFLIDMCNSDREILDRHEQFYLDLFPKKYNVCPRASNTELLVFIQPRAAAAMRGKKFTKEQKAELRRVWKRRIKIKGPTKSMFKPGHTTSESHRKNLSEAMKHSWANPTARANHLRGAKRSKRTWTPGRRAKQAEICRIIGRLPKKRRAQ